MDNTLLSIIIFAGFLILFGAAILSSQINMINKNVNITTESNGTAYNLSVIGGPSTQLLLTRPSCTLVSWDIFGCGASWLGWIFQFIFLNSDIAWLSIPLTAVGAVIIYRILRLLNPLPGGS